jgi:hypothetical protein
MHHSSLASFLEQLRRELASGLARETTTDALISTAPRRITVEVQITTQPTSDGGFRIEPLHGNAVSCDLSQHGPPAHRLTIELEVGVPAAVIQPPKPASAQPTVPIPAEESSEGGDPAILRRQLELVLGGPPGFTSGARADILAELLRGYGRRSLLEALQRDWISQFDTGPEASASVGNPPPDPQNGQ